MARSTSNMSGAPTRGGTAQRQGAGGRQAAPVPFVRASVEHSEPIGYDVSTVMTSGVQVLPDVVVPAYGFLRAITLVVTSTPGVGAGGTTALEDAPFSVLQNLILQEPNGAQICNFPSGYDAFLANKMGGYWFDNEIRTDGGFSISAGAAPTVNFVMRIPVEVCLRDAVASLPNQNSGAQFRLKMNLNSTTGVFGGAAITTGPTVRIRAYMEAWDQPEDNTDGQPNQTVPPALNTTQYWTRQDFGVNAGQQNVRLTRVGNLIRTLLFVFRSAGGSRAANDTQFPDPMYLYYDTRPLDTVSRLQHLQRMRDRYAIRAQVANSVSVAGTPIPVDSGLGRENGLWPYDFAHEFNGAVGCELRDLWLPTLSSTRLELQGVFGAAGTLTVLTNDVTIADNVWV